MPKRLREKRNTWRFISFPISMGLLTTSTTEWVTAR
jgi:hypothetical protein